MSIYHYTRPLKVPVWLFLEGKDVERNEAIAAIFCDQSLGAQRRWRPEVGFHETVLQLKNEGWAHRVSATYPFILDQDFMMVAANKHLGKAFGPNLALKIIDGDSHKLNRTIKKVNDYEALFLKILELQDNVSLSRYFNMEVVDTTKDPIKVFVTKGSPKSDIYQRLAKNVLTVGSKGSALKLTDLSAEESCEQIAEEIKNLLGNGK